MIGDGVIDDALMGTSKKFRAFVFSEARFIFGILNKDGFISKSDQRVLINTICLIVDENKAKFFIFDHDFSTRRVREFH
ncbi:hypothetical protein BpHYR1_019505 [Brachionus plicatilis]|uniref:Uncharacterized protein n=1 Tax=Brachionus plicatilis TaxID=10195 RepID=A0A3M7RKD7_BRAPC|nr:hypothetical protein BpHYR1_019505 [Brachionus plicatilis]